MTRDEYKNQLSLVYDEVVAKVGESVTIGDQTADDAAKVMKLVDAAFCIVSGIGDAILNLRDTLDAQ